MPHPQIELLWVLGTPLGDSQRVKITKLANGSPAATPSISAPLGPKQYYYPLVNLTTNLKAGDTYSWMVITTRGGASTPSQAKTFVVQPCPSGGGGGFGI